MIQAIHENQMCQFAETDTFRICSTLINFDKHADDGYRMESNVFLNIKLLPLKREMQHWASKPRILGWAGGPGKVYN